MKITEKLKEDHDQIRSFCKLKEGIKGESVQAGLLDLIGKINSILQKHAWVEDIFFYPIVRGALFNAKEKPLSMDFMDKHEIEHKTVDEMIQHLTMDLGSSSPQLNWLETFNQIHQALESHMIKEEEEVFPTALRLLGEERLEELYQDMMAQLK